MKTRLRILIILVVITAGFFSIPPTLTNICNTLEIYDERCPRIGGIQTPFGGKIQIWNTTPSMIVSVHDADTPHDFFMDNVTRFSIIHIGYNPSTISNLEVNMTQDLVIAGNVRYVPLWMFEADWNSSTPHDVMVESLEDENHKKISLPNAEANTGVFQQLIKIPKQYCGKGSISYHELGLVPIHEDTPKKIFVKYVLPDLSLSSGTYHMNFSSPYSIKFAIPDNFEVTYNNTTICPVSYTMSPPNVFFYDFTFKIK